MAHDNVVVVGIDGSEAGETALQWALAQAKARNARLHIVCAYEMPTYAAHAELNVPVAENNFLYEAAEEMVATAVASVQGQGVEVTSSLEFGDPTEVLVEMSKEVALIVVGGHSGEKGRLADRLLRTVSSGVPAYAYCPTVVIPQGSLAEYLPIKHVVVGVDGSEPAKTALQRAVWEADRWNAKLSIVAAVNAAPTPWIPMTPFREDLLVEVTEAVAAQLTEVDEGRDIDVRIHAVEGNPAQVLTECGEEIDLLIVGTRGHGGFTGLLLGSTSQTVLAHAACPVMVVPKRVRPDDDAGPAPEQAMAN
ncbi:MAG: universal stress protein [Trueperella sp.]|nr:universal stress protein [Trueperella sp.]